MKKIKKFFNYFTFLVCLLIPKKKNRWVFGAWFGDRVSDNPYALYNYVKHKMPNVECIWITNDIDAEKKLNINTIKRNSIIAIWKCLTAEVAVMNQGYLDFGDYNWIHNSYKVQLWHGVPWKKIGEDTSRTKKGALYRFSHKTFLFSNKCDLYIAPSEETRKVIRSAFLTDDSSILSVGQPRNELLMDSKACNDARMKLQETFGGYQKIIAYLPTFRDNENNTFSFLDIGDEILPILKKYNACILEKQHYVRKGKTNHSNEVFTSIINAEKYDTQEILASADVLITDYSSCFFDYLLRDKPIIHYAYDFEYYKGEDRGFYYDIDYVAAGHVVSRTTDLVAQIDRILSGEDDEAEKRQIVRERFDTYESKNNSEIIANEIIQNIGQ